MAKEGWHEEEIEIANELEAIPVPIVSDAILATTQVKGMAMVPVLLLDTTARPDIRYLIQSHKVLQQGEAISRWGRHPGKDDGRLLYFSSLASRLCLLSYCAWIRSSTAV